MVLQGQLLSLPGSVHNRNKDLCLHFINCTFWYHGSINQICCRLIQRTKLQKHSECYLLVLWTCWKINWVDLTMVQYSFVLTQVLNIVRDVCITHWLFFVHAGAFQWGHLLVRMLNQALKVVPHYICMFAIELYLSSQLCWVWVSVIQV